LGEEKTQKKTKKKRVFTKGLEILHMQWVFEKEKRNS
jgi:hypothetical protein